jgi:nicotinamide-nucleotide amidase
LRRGGAALYRAVGDVTKLELLAGEVMQMPELLAMAEAVGALLKERGETVAVSESSTGGLIAAALLAVPGASAYFIGGGVIYTHKAREVLLEKRLEDHPGMRASTEAYALLCASAIRERLGTIWGVGETGATGPRGNRYGDAPGHCCIAISGPRSRAITLETGQTDREANMWRFARAALDLLEHVVRSR